MSWQQRWLLARLLDLYQRREGRGTELQRRHIATWGVPWYPTRWWGLTRSHAAAVSRALARLEACVLVIRNKKTGVPSRGERDCLPLVRPLPVQQRWWLRGK